MNIDYVSLELKCTIKSRSSENMKEFRYAKLRLASNIWDISKVAQRSKRDKQIQI